MKSAAAFLTLLLLSAAAAAQQSFGVAGMEGLTQQSAPNGSAPKIIVLPAVIACPVAMEVRRDGGLHLLRSGKDGSGKDGSSKNAQSPQPDMTITLFLHGLERKEIASINITASGHGAPQGATPLETRTPLTPANPAPNAKAILRTMTVPFVPDGPGAGSSAFALPGFATLSFIQLNAVTYADGSIWNVAAPNACRVAPSLLMLVGGNH